MVPRARPQTTLVTTVALVGIDGSGKTTQAHRLAEVLAERGLPARYRRNAGGRRWFGRLAVVLGRRDGEHLLGRRGMLLVESVLRWLAILRTLLRRAVTREVTVMDRFSFCQYAALRARGAGPAAERRARFAYRLFPPPGVTFLLDVDPVTAYDRIETRGYDHEEPSYLRAAAAAYRELPEAAGFVVIDGGGTPDEVLDRLVAGLDAHLADRVPAPRARSARAVVLTLGSLLAGLTMLGYQLAEVL